jgi:hypothetical protein
MSLEERIKSLVAAMQELKDGKKRSPQPRRANPKWLLRIQSLSDMLHILISKVRPKIAKVRAWVRVKIRELKSYVDVYLNKLKENLKVFAINLAPLRSDVQDQKDKKAETEAKLKIIREKVAKIKKLILLGSFVTKMARGSLKVISNVSKGNYKFSENEVSIDMILDGLYSYKAYEQSGPVVASLTDEKMRVKTQFKSLILIETLTYGLIETFNEIKNTNFANELDSFIKEQGANAPGSGVLKSFQNIIKNPPKTPLEFKQAANIFAVGALEDARVATRIVELERKYLSRSRQAVATLCSVKKLEGTRFEKTLLKVKYTLDKNQSFIILAFRLLTDEIRRFMSFISKKVQEFILKIKKLLQRVKERVMDDFKKQTKKERDKRINVDALAMSFAFGLAARSFWTGASWIGPTGTNHVSLTIGPFKPIKAKSTDGASKMIREVAKSFERQLQVMNGIATPVAATGIPPIPFVGYK